MTKANFDEWCTRQSWTVGDAAMLLLSLEPTGEYPPWFDPKKPQLNRQYHDIIDAARSDLGRKLSTKWEPYSPVLPATRANATYVYVLPGDWITWAQKRKFKIPQQLQAFASRLPRTPMLQGKRQAELEDLLQKLEDSAVSIGQTFDRERMPGTKDQLKREIKAHCPKLGNLGGPTLNDYITRAGCKFRGGRNQRETDLWKRLPLLKTRVKRTP